MTMQLSYGEQSLEIEDFKSGTVRVLGIYPDPALFPRLGIRLGWTLREIPPTGPGQFQSTGLSDYQVVDVAGELRLREGGVLVGLLWPTQGNLEFRSSPYHSENQVTVACDLDLARLERVEEHRQGQSISFSMGLWPTVVRGGQRLRSRIDPLLFQLPRDTWLEFLTSVRFGEYEVLELRRPTHDLEAFAEVREQLEGARRRVQRGEYTAAVAAVRAAIERVAQDVRGNGPALKDLLAVPTDDVRGEAYAGILNRLKELCNRAIHKPEATVSYSRPEAIFIIRTAESIIALIGQLLPRVEQ